MSEKLYRQYDRAHYSSLRCASKMRHLSAMTIEDLGSKSDIAKELAYRDDQIKALQAEVERLKSAPLQTIEVLKKLKANAETTSQENPPTDDSGGEFDAIWMNDLNGLIEDAISYAGDICPIQSDADGGRDW